MTTLNLFEKDGVKLFQKVVSAKFVETKETSIFDVNEKNDDSEESVQVEEDMYYEEVEELLKIEEAPPKRENQVSSQKRSIVNQNGIS